MPTTEEKQTPPPTKPRRRWKRWLLGFFILFAAFLIWANGPGLRWALTKVINSQLEAQELSGDFEVRGTALSGISLHDLSLKGPGLIQSADSNLVEVTWSLASLLDRELESLTIDRFHLTVDPSAPAPTSPKSPDDPDTESAPLSETLNLVRGLIENAEISFTDLKVEIIDTTQVTLSSLTHKSGTRTYLISGLESRDHLGRPINNPATTLTWTEEGLEADKITLLPNLAFSDLIFYPDQKASLNLLLADNQISLNSDLRSSHQLNLISPELPLSVITALALPELPLFGTITNLEIDTSKGLLDLRLRNLSYQKYRFQDASLTARTPDLLSPFDQAVTLSLALDQQILVNGTVTPDRELLDSAADLAFTVNWPEIPSVSGEIAYDSREARIIAESLETLRVTARYLVDQQSYQAEALATIKDASTLETPVVGPLTFAAQAKGDLKAAIHTGTLNLTELNLRQPDLPEATSSGVITWDWPKQVAIQDLTMTSPEGVLKTRLFWQDDTLTIEKLNLIDDGTELLAITASLPAPLKTSSLDELLASTQAASLKISSQPLSFEKLSSFAPLPKDLRGIVQADLSLSGTLGEPVLDGFATLDDFRLTSQPDLPPVDLDLQLKTTDETLSLTANAREPGGPLLDLEGKLPFRPRAWIYRTTDPANAPISLTARTPELNLRRIQPFVPAITSIDGTLKLNLAVAGTLATPDLSGSANARISRMRLEGSPISDFQNSTLSATFADKKITVRPSIINASGGTATLKGSIDLASPEPLLDLGLSGEYLLLYRTPDFSFRGNPKLRLSGSLAEATISGELQLVESLIYKDVEILPFGVPRTSEIPSPNLPSFAPRVTKKAGPSKAPSGPMTWKLDIDVSTRDPILIRGNLAKGEVTGQVKVSGTIGDPKTSGTLTTRDLAADLPFSELKVQTGVITLRPNALTNPTINLRGSSEVGQYTIQVYLSGPVQNPKLVLTSDPPMPESEIMLLLATGSASDQLADTQLASQKALQYLFEGLRRRNRGKDKSVLQRLIKNSDQIELSLGDTNQFSGRRFSSASLEITDQWDFTTQIDEQGQTRALVIFSVRLK